MDWSQHFPAFVSSTPATISATPSTPPAMTQRVTIADIGCGFGGLLFALSPRFPSSLILGLEIRTTVTEFVSEKIKAMRVQSLPTPTASSQPSSPYQNISVLRANTMKFLPNLFPRASLQKIFLCFPDPHFKARKHKARIVSSGLVAEYAYALAPDTGRLYTITDVRDLHEWMTGHLAGSASFERVAGEEELERDECVEVMRRETEEGKKVERNGGRKFVGVWRRVREEAWPEEGEGQGG